MSLSTASKRIAQEAGVSIIPGYLGSISSTDDLLRIANDIGYPVMIKASAGGGGKGMRIAYSDTEALDGYRLSKAEAKSSFGDDTMFVEKFIEEPRHIEIQLLADSQGNAVWLNERECSVQRRNQKVIEEAPSTFLTSDTRRAMGEQAVALAKAVGYESAGTCEFLVDRNRRFYFLEMNTRLQVEHPVTEAITGIDLVEHMIRVAAGEPLAIRQEDVQLKGWALESRVYAEDPLRGFLPSIGKLVRYQEPSGPGVRVDSGVREGSEISVYYDPMISKLVSYGKDRTEALAIMRSALDRYVIRGVTHNINFLRSLCDHPRFIRGDLTTKFIQDEYPEGYKGAEMSDEDVRVLIGSAVLVRGRLIRDALSVGEGRKGWDAEQEWDQAMKEWVVTLREQRYVVHVLHASISDRQQQLTAAISTDDSEPHEVTLTSSYEVGDSVLTIEVDSAEHTLQVASLSSASSRMSLITRGTTFPLLLHSPTQDELQRYMPKHVAPDTSKQVLSPMPGVVFSVKVQEGEEVAAGQEVCVVEAMKMQNALRVSGHGKVKKILVKQGQTVSSDQVLIELE